MKVAVVAEILSVSRLLIRSRSERTLEGRAHSRIRRWALIAIGTWLGLSLSSQAQIVLNEVMADNQGAVENGADFPDYIEIHNRGGGPVALGNYSVTDDPVLPRKYVIPDGTTI